MISGLKKRVCMQGACVGGGKLPACGVELLFLRFFGIERLYHPYGGKELPRGGVERIQLFLHPPKARIADFHVAQYKKTHNYEYNYQHGACRGVCIIISTTAPMQVMGALTIMRIMLFMNS